MRRTAQCSTSAVAEYLDTVPNRIALTGHTDVTPFGNGDAGYTNWELSADRANAARRALISGGLRDDKFARVVGLSSTALFDKANPENPINRRISILVMTRDAEQRMFQSLEQSQQVSDAESLQALPLPAANNTNPAAVVPPLSLPAPPR